MFNFSPKTKDSLKQMPFDKLKKYAEKLKKKGYKVKNLNKFVDTSEGHKDLIKHLIKAQEKGKQDDTPKNDCTNYNTQRDCMRGPTPADVKQMAENCGVDIKKYTTKLDRCKQLMELKPCSKKKDSKKDNSKKNSDEYKKYNKYKLRSSTGEKSILDIAAKKKIEYVEQSGQKVLLKKATKENIIYAILKYDKKRAKEKNENNEKNEKNEKVEVKPKKSKPKKSKPKKSKLDTESDSESGSDIKRQEKEEENMKNKKYKKKKHKIIEKIVLINGENKYKYNNWSLEELKQKLESINNEKEEDDQEEDDQEENDQEENAQEEDEEKDEQEDVEEDVEEEDVEDEIKPNKCSGLTREEFDELSGPQIRDKLKSLGLVNGLPISRDEKFNLMCDAQNNGRCDPEEGQWCNGDFICDASNKPGVCVSKTSKTSKDETYEYKGKKIVGAPDVIKRIKQALENKTVEPKISSKKDEEKDEEKQRKLLIENIIKNILILKPNKNTEKYKKKFNKKSIEKLQKKNKKLEKKIKKRKVEVEKDEEEVDEEDTNEVDEEDTNEVEKEVEDNEDEDEDNEVVDKQNIYDILPEVVDNKNVEKLNDVKKAAAKCLGLLS